MGLSHSLLNRAVYDRGRDWVLPVDYPAGVTVTPADSGPRGTAFRVEAVGREVALRFRPRFYGRHRGLVQFAPWTYRTWRPSVAGWTSWYAFRDRVTEDDVRRTADAIAETLAPFGYEYVQIDDGYQRTPMGLPDTWLQTNGKFPGGLPGLTELITARGLRSGLWTNVSFQQRVEALARPQLFVRTADGRPAYGNWVGYVMDGSEEALDALVRPVYRALRAMGWSYYKVDALRHLRYEGYNSHRGFFHESPRIRLTQQGLDERRGATGESCNCCSQEIGTSGYCVRKASPRDSRSARSGSGEPGAFPFEMESTAGTDCHGLSHARSYYHPQLVRRPQSKRAPSPAEYDLPDDAGVV